MALCFRVIALQRTSEKRPLEGKKVLLVDIRGPTRETGDGVRVMGMLMDLQACGHNVDVLSDSRDYEELRASWPTETVARFFQGVRWWKAHANMTPSFQLSDFDQILIGAKLDLLYTDERRGHAVPHILAQLRNHTGNRRKVMAFWDDVPFERCNMKPQAAEICPRVPDVVRDVAKIAHRFYVLSIDDRRRFIQAMIDHGIPVDNLEVRIWPMMISNMQKVLPYRPFRADPATQSEVVMMGNLHAVNRYMVTSIFKSGAMGKICKAIERRGSSIKIRFIGGVADVAQEQKALHANSSTCVVAHTGFMSDLQFEHEIYPRARAVLNPFFEDVNSGISVKNFESIMSGIPFLTSEYGMHGLSDEIRACASFPMAENPEDATSFAKFFISHVVDDTGYLAFSREFVKLSPNCIQGQLQQYPLDRRC